MLMNILKCNAKKLLSCKILFLPMAASELQISVFLHFLVDIAIAELVTAGYKLEF